MSPTTHALLLLVYAWVHVLVFVGAAASAWRGLRLGTVSTRTGPFSFDVTTRADRAHNPVMDWIILMTYAGIAVTVTINFFTDVLPEIRDLRR